MRLLIAMVLLCTTFQTFAIEIATSGSGGWSSSSSAIRSTSGSSWGAGWYSDPKLIVYYSLQQGLMLYTITAYKYWY